MSTDAASGVNLGDALRDGFVLTASESVALVYEICRQVDERRIKHVARQPAQISITEDARVVSHAASDNGEPAVAIASLLDTLLPADAGAALKSLPSRLRDSDPRRHASLKDLLAVLRYHLPDGPRMALHQLAARLSAPTTAPEEFAAEAGDPPPVMDLPLQAASPVVVAMPPRPHRSRTVIAAIALMLIVLSAVVGFYLTNSMARPDAAVAQSTAAPTPAPRVTFAPPPPEALASTPAKEPHAEPLPLDAPDGVFSPSFGADGAALFFHTGRDAGRLQRTALSGDDQFTPQAILSGSAHNFHVRPSPDGQRLAFDSDRDGTRAVYVGSRDGANIQQVSGPGFAAVPSWSPDQKWLAFVRGETSRPHVWNLWLRDMTTGELTRVSNFPGGQVWSASWFPDSQSISFSHDDQLIVMDLTTSRTRAYPSPLPRRLARTPAVSPDGTRIVFQVFGDGVWMLDVRNGGMHRILDDGTAEEFAWDPRGRRIAYHSRRDGRWRIWMLTI
jgi:YD repeat-containing protein